MGNKFVKRDDIHYDNENITVHAFSKFSSVVDNILVESEKTVYNELVYIKMLKNMDINIDTKFVNINNEVINLFKNLIDISHLDINKQSSHNELKNFLNCVIKKDKVNEITLLFSNFTETYLKSFNNPIFLDADILEYINIITTEPTVFEIFNINKEIIYKKELSEGSHKINMWIPLCNIINVPDKIDKIDVIRFDNPRDYFVIKTSNKIDIEIQSHLIPNDILESKIILGKHNYINFETGIMYEHGIFKNLLTKG
jgi:hypothetical protein